MYNRQLPVVLRYVRKLVGAEATGESIDRELLERFAARREEAAFEALLRRHGPMVLGACRRILQDADAAEDAFQATFFVLVRKAASLDRRGSVAGWLYTVAYRLALKAKAAAFRRRVCERPIEDLPAAEPSSDSIWWELRPILDEELSRLPEKLSRTPRALLSRRQNQQASCSGTRLSLWDRSSRLARGRDLLRSRLSRRDLALTPALLATALTPTALSAAIPATLQESTCKAALLFAAGATGQPGRDCRYEGDAAGTRPPGLHAPGAGDHGLPEPGHFAGTERAVNQSSRHTPCAVADGTRGVPCYLGLKARRQWTHANEKSFSSTPRPPPSDRSCSSIAKPRPS